MLSVFTDISEIKKQEAELIRLKDGIDILPNGFPHQLPPFKAHNILVCLRKTFVIPTGFSTF